jgi:hypothetical protein
MEVKKLETSEMLIAKKWPTKLDRAARLEKLKKSREKRKALETDQERDLRLQQMKEATKRSISNETSQDRSIRLKDAVNLT